MMHTERQLKCYFTNVSFEEQLLCMASRVHVARSLCQTLTVLLKQFLMNYYCAKLQQ